jgi:ring-1,2-phenylacetyl-CoA epoxidase subunit PaaE
MSTPHFHALFVKRIEPLTAQAAAITFAIPPSLRDEFEFLPGQFVTLRAMVDGQAVRRSYSLCSTPAQLASAQEITVGIKRVEGGVFSTWATTVLHVGDEVDVMPPDGRFTPKAALGAPQAGMQADAKAKVQANIQGVHRLGLAAGSGITPILSIMAHTLASDASSRFTLVYGNQRINTIMFHEALQDLKDRYANRVSLVHVLSRQPQEVDLLQGRLDEAKITALLEQLVPAAQIAEVFICGPEAMIESAERALAKAGIAPGRVHAERFATGYQFTTKTIAARAGSTHQNADNAYEFALEVILDGKGHSFGMHASDNVLDTALAGNLDLPYACKAGVCCTCRAKVLEGKVTMEKNFTLEQWEIDKGFVLTCQAHCASGRVVVSYDER